MAIELIQDSICEVSNISNYILVKKIYFTALQNGLVEKRLLVGGHDLELKTWRIQVSKGEKFHLWYPFWKNIRAGGSINLSEIAQRRSAPGKRTY